MVPRYGELPAQKFVREEVMKKRSFTGLFGVLLLLVLATSVVFYACNLDPETENTEEEHRDGGDETDTRDTWTKSWEGYSKDNLPPPSYWNMKGENWYWPNPFIMIDGTPVTTKAEWAQRYEELKVMLQHYLYGYLPPKPESQEFSATVSTNSVTITIKMSQGGKNATVSTTINLPTNNASSYTAPWPVSLGGTTTVDGVRGYAIAGYPSYDAAATTLFGSTRNDPGDLIMTAWSAGRLIDAIEYLTQTGRPLNGILAPDQFTITGHSRGGKDAIVGAAFEPRIKVAAPSSSGALGCAPERFILTMVRPMNGLGNHAGNPTGKGYWYTDAARAGGNDLPKTRILQYLVPGVPPPGYVREYGPIQSIQGYDHARSDSTAGGSAANGVLSTWVGSRFAEFARFQVDRFWTTENGYEGKGSMAQVPFDQHFLTSLMAGPDPDHPRAVLMSGGNDGDSWINPEGMHILFLATREVYKFLEQQGVQNATNLVAEWIDNSNGHNHTTIRRQRQMDLCDYVFRGVPLPADFMDKDANGSFYHYGAEYPLDVRSWDDYKLLNWAAPGEKSLAEIANEFFGSNPQYPR